MVLVRSTSLYHVHYSRVCAGLTGLPAALYARLRRFWFAYKRNGSVGIWFWCVSTILYHVHFSRAARGEPACRWLYTHRRGDFGPHTSGTGGCGFGFRVFQQLNSLSMSSPGCAGGTGFPAALYARLRRFLFAYRNGRMEIWLGHFFVYFYAEHFTWAARGTPACRRISTHGYGDFNSYTSGTGE